MYLYWIYAIYCSTSHHQKYFNWQSICQWRFHFETHFLINYAWLRLDKYILFCITLSVFYSLKYHRLSFTLFNTSSQFSHSSALNIHSCTLDIISTHFSKHSSQSRTHKRSLALSFLTLCFLFPGLSYPSKSSWREALEKISYI